MLDSIVKVYCVYSRSDWLLPWQAHPKREGTGTGFVIRGRLILTNAHVVADQTYITVKRHGSGTKYRADGGGGGARARAHNGALTHTHTPPACRPAHAPPRTPSPPPRRPPAVVAIGHAVDLALLTVADEAFWTEPGPMLPLALGDVPALQENVLVRARGRGGGRAAPRAGPRGAPPPRVAAAAARERSAGAVPPAPPPSHPPPGHRVPHGRR